MKTIKDIVVLTSNIDSDGDKFDIENMVLPEMLPVFEQFDHSKKICDCILNKKNGTVVSEFINNITLCELDLTLYPAIQFRVEDEGIKLHEDTGVWDINKIELISVGLCINQNSDKSIKTIGEQLKLNKGEGLLINKTIT